MLPTNTIQVVSSIVSDNAQLGSVSFQIQYTDAYSRTAYCSSPGQIYAAKNTPVYVYVIGTNASAYSSRQVALVTDVMAWQDKGVGSATLLSSSFTSTYGTVNVWGACQMAAEGAFGSYSVMYGARITCP